MGGGHKKFSCGVSGGLGEGGDEPPPLNLSPLGGRRPPLQQRMAYLNENYLKLQAGYLFPEVARRVREFCEANPEAAKRLIRCGIGDVTEPLPRAAIDAMKRAIGELGHRETFRGYGPEHGYEFL